MLCLLWIIVDILFEMFKFSLALVDKVQFIIQIIYFLVSQFRSALFAFYLVLISKGLNDAEQPTNVLTVKLGHKILDPI